MGWVHPWVGLGWVRSHFSAYVTGWVGLNEKYCGIVAEYCRPKTHTIHCPYVLNYFSPLIVAFLLPGQYTGITDIDILFPLFSRRHSCEIKDM